MRKSGRMAVRAGPASSRHSWSVRVIQPPARAAARNADVVRQMACQLLGHDGKKRISRRGGREAKGDHAAIWTGMPEDVAGLVRHRFGMAVQDIGKSLACSIVDAAQEPDAIGEDAEGRRLRRQIAEAQDPAAKLDRLIGQRRSDRCRNDEKPRRRKRRRQDAFGAVNDL